MSNLYIGVVEDRSTNDPYQIGRCKVRIFGLHTEDKTLLPTSNLPWAVPLGGTGSAGVDGIGNSPTGLVEGSWVAIQFAETDYFQQMPIIMGSLPGKPGAEPQDSGLAEPLVSDETDQAAQGTCKPAALPTEPTPGIEEQIKSHEAVASLVQGENKSASYSASKTMSGSTQLYAYNIGDGKWTIGWGNTYFINGKNVGPNDSITLDEANTLWREVTKRDIMTPIRNAIKVPVTLSMYEALVSLAYNTGVGGVKSSAIMTTLNRGDYQGAARAITTFRTTVKGNYNQGLANRRKKESEYFLKDGLPGLDGVIEEQLPSPEARTATDGSIDYSSSSEKAPAFSDINGVYPKNKNESSTNRLARNAAANETDRKPTIVDLKEASIIHNVPIAGGGNWNQPEPAFAARYPYNHVKATESGHVMEYDDTPGAERIAQWHKAGTYYEIDNSGSKVTRIIGDNYEILDRNGFVYVRGDINITVLGDTNIYTENDLNIEARGDITMAASGNMTLGCGGNLILGARGNTTVEAGSSLALEGSMTYINSGRRAGVKLPSVPSVGKTELPPLGRSNRYNEIAATDDDVGGPGSSTKAKNPTAFKEQPAEDYIDGNGPFKERPKKEDKVEAVNTTVAGGKGIAVTPITVAPGRTGAGLDPNMQLSKHLKLKDLLTPSSLCGNPAKIIEQNGFTIADIINSARGWSVNWGDVLVEKYGKFNVNSWFRSAAYSQAIADKNARGGGSRGAAAGKGSAHGFGEAVDITWPDIAHNRAKAMERAKEIAKLGIPFDQIICEYSNNSCWIHVCYKSQKGRGNRGMLLGPKFVG
jgi:GH24 family phage-related lysozyme (muramidase)